MEKPGEHFKRLISDASIVSEYEAKVRKILGVDWSGPGSVEQARTKAVGIFSSESAEGLSAQRDVMMFINKAANLSASAAQLISQHDSMFKAEIAFEGERRRFERKMLWILWLQQTARWVVGAVIAITVYSCAVNLAESVRFNGWIHVPVHDWIQDWAKRAPSG